MRGRSWGHTNPCCMSPDTFEFQYMTHQIHNSYTEDVSDEWFKLAFAVTRQKRLDTREKELCILAVLAEYDAPYLLYAHSNIAVQLGFTEAQVQAAVSGTLTAGLNERESAVYSLALKLANLRHPMDDETFEQARGALERDEIAGVAHIVSGYIYVAMLTNLSNLGNPEEKAGLFVATKSAALHRQEEGL
jgi:alkylhydroperoxidase/carboxymuconolactone decarboxylase family protein YurZ